jgi:peptidoglycan/LPS O-acetylase OafA/YrhL
VKVNDRSEVLDAVRGIAIAFVVGRHHLPQYNTFGAMGVDLFFVLSGYLIGGILIDNRGAPFFHDILLAPRSPHSANLLRNVHE